MFLLLHKLTFLVDNNFPHMEDSRKYVNTGFAIGNRICSNMICNSRTIDLTVASIIRAMNSLSHVVEKLSKLINLNVINVTTCVPIFHSSHKKWLEYFNHTLSNYDSRVHNTKT